MLIEKETEEVVMAICDLAGAGKRAEMSLLQGTRNVCSLWCKRATVPAAKSVIAESHTGIVVVV